MSARSEDFKGHTPGPLSVEVRESGCLILAGRCTIGAAYETSDNPGADARLWAAAPALLRERDEAREDLSDLRGDVERHGGRRCDIPACNCNGTHWNRCSERIGELCDIEKDLRAQVAKLRAALGECRQWHRSDKWREDPDPENRREWKRHGDAIDAALAESEPRT